MIGSYTKIYRACFLAPMRGPHHFAALLEGGGGGRDPHSRFAVLVIICVCVCVFRCARALKWAPR